ncbi:hypothetical protein JMJ78_0000927, partial [Colletotrichum scovillei]
MWVRKSTYEAARRLSHKSAWPVTTHHDKKNSCTGQ